MGAASRIVQAAIEVLAKKGGGALPTDEASRTFYRGTTPGDARRIDEPFSAASGMTFAARKPESAQMYGSSIEELISSPGARILDDESPEFWKLVGRRRPPNGYVGSARGGPVEVVNDAVTKAKAAGYDAVSFSSDSDIGTVILNEGAFTRRPHLPTDEASRMAVNKSEKDASDIFGAGATRVIYKDQATGGYIEVVKRPDGPSSVIDLQVPEQHRRRGVGAALQKAALDDNPKLMGQVSSKSAARSAFNQGRRPYDDPNATIDDVLRSIDENSSVNMTNLNLPTDEASRMARAREMGFDTDAPLYRGTTEQGATTAQKSFEAGDGIFLSDNPDVAEIFRYPREYGEVITENYDDALGEFVGVEPGDLQTLYARMQNPMRLSGENANKFTEDTAYQIGVIKAARAAGNDSIVVENVMEGVGDWTEPGTTVVALRPVRAKAAKFDPAKAGSADILAGLAGLGVLGAGAAALPQDDSDMVSALRGM